MHAYIVIRWRGLTATTFQFGRIPWLEFLALRIDRALFSLYIHSVLVLQMFFGCVPLLCSWGVWCVHSWHVVCLHVSCMWKCENVLLRIILHTHRQKRVVVAVCLFETICTGRILFVLCSLSVVRCWWYIYVIYSRECIVARFDLSECCCSNSVRWVVRL